VAVRLVAVEGLDEGRTYDVSGHGLFIFGREGVVLTRSGEPPSDGYTSRHHAALEVAGATACVSDLRSKNGTFVNGKRLAAGPPTALRHGDRLKLGRTVLRVDITSDAVPAAAEPVAPRGETTTPRVRRDASPPAPPPSPVPPAPRRSAPPPVPPSTPSTPSIAQPPSPPPPAPAPSRPLDPERTRVRMRPEVPESTSRSSVRAADRVGEGAGPVAPSRRASRDANTLPGVRSKGGTPPSAGRAGAPAHERPISEFERGTKLGEGGHAIVYRATDRVTGGRVALKIMRTSGEPPPTAAREFVREIEVHAGLVHDHIVGVVAYGSERGVPWLALEYVDGTDLERKVVDDGPLDPAQALSIGDAILGALAFAHERGFIHRDVTPANVLLRGWPGPWTPLLADFGLAKAWQSAGSAILTATATAKGSLAYAAPEQVKDAKRAGPSADQYGLAATLYYALTRASHLDGDIRGLLAIRTVLDAPIVPLARRRANLPTSLCAVIDKALSRDPAGRFESVEAMRRALRSG